MRYILVALLGLYATTSYAKVDCETHKVYCKIIKLQPRMDKARAMELSNIIYKNAKEHNIDPMISVAILNQENRFRDIHTYEVERKEEAGCHMTSCVKKVVEHHEVADMTLAQINVRTAVGYGFDLQRLYDHDTEYAIECHMDILADKIKQCDHLGDMAWSCYHSVTPKYREKYVEMVSRYL